MDDLLLVVDVQRGFINEFTVHIPSRIGHLIEREQFSRIAFTQFVNTEEGPYPRFTGWRGCTTKAETEIMPELAHLAEPNLTFAKPGYAGISEGLAIYLQEHNIQRVSIVGIDTDMCVLKVALDIFDLNIEPIVLVDCCASTSGLQSHLAGLAVLARNIGAQQLRDTGLSEGYLAAPPRVTEHR